MGPETELTSRLADPKRVSLVASVVTEAELLVAPLRTGGPVSIAVDDQPVQDRPAVRSG
ncbi:MAG: hypothetical protein ABIS18_10160 [Actinomycetota bacterium]